MLGNLSEGVAAEITANQRRHNKYLRRPLTYDICYSEQELVIELNFFVNDQNIKISLPIYLNLANKTPIFVTSAAKEPVQKDKTKSMVSKIYTALRSGIWYVLTQNIFLQPIYAFFSLITSLRRNKINKLLERVQLKLDLAKNDVTQKEYEQNLRAAEAELSILNRGINYLFLRYLSSHELWFKYCYACAQLKYACNEDADGKKLLLEAHSYADTEEHRLLILRALIHVMPDHLLQGLQTNEKDLYFAALQKNTSALQRLYDEALNHLLSIVAHIKERKIDEALNLATCSLDPFTKALWPKLTLMEAQIGATLRFLIDMESSYPNLARLRLERSILAPLDRLKEASTLIAKYFPEKVTEYTTYYEAVAAIFDNKPSIDNTLTNELRAASSAELMQYRDFLVQTEEQAKRENANIVKPHLSPNNLNFKRG